MSDQTPVSDLPTPAPRFPRAVVVAALVLAGAVAVLLLLQTPNLPDLVPGSWFGGGEPPAPMTRAFALYLEEHPDSPLVTGLASPDEREGVHRTLLAFYEENGHRPAWFDGDEPSPRAAELVEVLRRAERDGLEPGRYRPALLADRLRRMEGGAAYRDVYPLDTLLSQAFVVFGHHLASGQVNPSSLGTAWLMEPRNMDLARALGDAAAGGPEGVVERLRPPHPGYGELQEALERYRGIAEEGGWPKVPDGPMLAVGDPAPRARLRALVQRLAAEGDLEDRRVGLGPPDRRVGLGPPEEGKNRRVGLGPPDRRVGLGPPGKGGSQAPPPDRAVYDEELAAAVHRFQDRHGITEDGKLGPETLAALNVPADQRVRQIELNLERWRWLPGELGERRVEVNLPGYFLSLKEGDRTAATLRVVVGKAGAATLAFSDRMAYVVINPYWNVPQSIVAAEIAPQVREDPSYLARNDYEVVEGYGEDARPVDPGEIDWGRVAGAGGGDFPYLVRQRPGPGNALGRIKFMFPNDHNIYLHDTPAQHLFREVERTFSHGCIRVEGPLELAEWAFAGDPEWNRARIERVIASGEHTSVSLPDEIPVYLLYWTAWVDRGGNVQFRKDIYDHDELLARALEERDPRHLARPAAGG